MSGQMSTKNDQAGFEGTTGDKAGSAVKIAL